MEKFIINNKKIFNSLGEEVEKNVALRLVTDEIDKIDIWKKVQQQEIEKKHLEKRDALTKQKKELESLTE